MGNENNENKDNISSDTLENETAGITVNQSNVTKKKIVYYSNYPISSIKDYKEGVDAISEMVANKNVFNIGIIAPYGAGKSSLIKTYRKTLDQIQNDRMVEVSLVHLSEHKKISKQEVKQQSSEEKETQDIKTSNNSQSIIEEESETDEEDERAYDKTALKNKDALLEKSILEQLFFREKKSSLPSSRIDRIHSRVTIAIWFSILVVLSFILSLFAVMQFNKQLPLLDEKVSWQGSTNAHNYNLSILFALAAIHIGATIFLLFLLFKNGKLKLKNIEIDFDKIESGSVLNFFLDEIIYYFEKTKINVVVFEDIERFGSVSLFTKLREINHILNNNKRINHKITFIYCVTDDFFAKEEDRAKFFEFVLSLVPVMNSNNAANHINSCLKENGSALDDVFVKGISRFITDKRVLNDIINDFLYFRISLEKLNGSFLYNDNSGEKLFAMMVYKNIFFNDYVKLLKNKGELFNLFSEYKNKLVKNITVTKEQELKAVEEEIKNVTERSYVARRFEDLKNIVIGVLSKSGNTSITVPKGFDDILSIKTFENVKTGVFVSIQATIPQYYQQSVTGITYKSLTIEEINKRLDAPIIQIEKTITGQMLDELNQKKFALGKDIYEANQSTLQQLLGISNGLYPKNAFLENRLIYYILSNGYIDETYYLYIGQSDSQIDREFVNSVLCNTSSDHSIDLKNCDLTISELSSFGLREFQKKSIFNYSLVEYLFSGKRDYSSQQSAFLEFLCKSKDKETKQFVKEFVLSNYDSSRFFAQLCIKDKEAVFDLFNGDNVSEKDKIRIIRSLIGVSPKIDMRSLNKDGVITRVVENNQNPLGNFVDLFKDFDSFIDFFEQIDLRKLKYLDYCEEEKANTVWNEAFNYLVDNLSFEINYDNIQTIELHYFYKSDVSVSTLIENTNALTDYVKDNFDTIINLISENNGSLHESPLIIKQILQNTELSSETKKSFISSLADPVDYDSSFSQNVINLLLIQNKMTRKWSYVTEVFKNANEEIKQSIVSFVFEGIDSFTEKITDKNLLLYLFSSYDDDKQELLEKIAKMSEIKLSIDDVRSDQKCKILIANDVIDSNEENILKCADKIDSFIVMLRKNSELESVVNKAIFNESGLIRILQSAQINPDCKQSILKANSNVVEENLSNDNLCDLIVDLLMDTHRVSLKAETMAAIANRMIEREKKDMFDFVVDSCLLDYNEKELVFFINAVDNSTIYSLIPEDNGHTIQIETSDLSTNKYLKALLDKKIIEIARHGPVHTRINVGTLLLILIADGILSKNKGS